MFDVMKCVIASTFAPSYLTEHTIRKGTFLISMQWNYDETN